MFKIIDAKIQNSICKYVFVICKIYLLLRTYDIVNLQDFFHRLENLGKVWQKFNFAHIKLFWYKKYLLCITNDVSSDITNLLFINEKKQKINVLLIFFLVR